MRGMIGQSGAVRVFYQKHWRIVEQHCRCDRLDAAMSISLECHIVPDC